MVRYLFLFVSLSLTITVYSHNCMQSFINSPSDVKEVFEKVRSHNFHPLDDDNYQFY